MEPDMEPVVCMPPIMVCSFAFVSGIDLAPDIVVVHFHAALIGSSTTTANSDFNTFVWLGQFDVWFCAFDSQSHPPPMPRIDSLRAHESLFHIHLEFVACFPVIMVYSDSSVSRVFVAMQAFDIII